MIKFNDNEKRWLEIIFYSICQKIFNINQKTEEVLDFIKGFRWTNFYDCDILLNTILKDKILINTTFIPNKQEFAIIVQDPTCRLRIKQSALKELTADTHYKLTRSVLFKMKMRQEVYPVALIPRLTQPNVHNAIYSFLLATRYIADIVKEIKF